MPMQRRTQAQQQNQRREEPTGEAKTQEEEDR
jgi:hypothetical protein